MLLQAFGVLRHHLRRHTLVSTFDSTPLLQPGDALLLRVLGAPNHHLRHLQGFLSCFFRLLVR